MSAESGLKTFRDADGLWEGHDVMEVATPQAFERNPELVLEFYNQRRKQLKEVSPNEGHIGLAKLEEHFNVHIITQNVDNLHERAGSSNVIHLHGELNKVRSTFDEDLVLDWTTDLNLGDFCEHNHQLRPHIVWFGEAVPMLDHAISITEQADILIVIGTSMQVYPAASLINFVHEETLIYFIDPKPNVTASKRLTIIEDTASKGVKKVTDKLLRKD
ncbi:Sir2 family NAD-dependent protein deacetylase [Croceibacter atlanticus]|uniref:Sir2 family NAD-dependent protein deacetylase n=1 Tax=Croceibacter atlanticus TaxID=313588 RepID=UPI0024B98757|nr:Sir2 family NAD-dependent protein deacetylase [Croceibacter atlanticus]